MRGAGAHRRLRLHRFPHVSHMFRQFAASPALGTLALIAVQSRRTHTGAGGFDLKIDHLQPVAGPVSVEPRMIGSGHLIVFQFNVPVVSVATVAAEDVVGTSYPGVSHTISGNEVVVTLTGIVGALVLFWIVRRTPLRFLFERPELFWIAPKKPLKLQPAH